MYCVACVWITEGRKSGNCILSSAEKYDCTKFIDNRIGNGCHYEIVQREPWSGTIYLED